MKIVIFGLSITSSWGNGHATTFRSLVKALARNGHTVHFVEKDVEWYRNNRDLPNPEFCKLHLYEDWAVSRRALLQLASDADAVVVGSYFPDAVTCSRELIEAGYGPVLFYDIDTPVTLAQLDSPEGCPYLDPGLIPEYDAYLSFSGGKALRVLERRYGSPNAVAFYCSVDPEAYRAVPPADAYRAELSYLGTYAADRQPGLMRLLNGPASLLPQSRFLVAGPQYPPEIAWAKNVTVLPHVAPPDHPAFYSSARFTLNLTRADMIAMGYSPSVRLFEASMCEAAILSDFWEGLDHFLTPGEEILLPNSPEEVTEILQHLTDAERCSMGKRARERMLTEHTSYDRARQFEQVVSECRSAGRSGRVEEFAEVSDT